jgi:amino acid transporter
MKRACTKSWKPLKKSSEYTPAGCDGRQQLTQSATEQREARARLMGFRDLVLFYVVTGISLRWIATAASVGPSSIAVWMGAWLLFYLPLALSVIELSSRYPSEGGMYVWASEAFGDGAGFLAGWLYWSSNLPYFPAVLYFAASNILFLRADWRGQSHNQTYFLWFSIVAMTVLTVVNLVGLNVAKWTYNVGALGMWIPVTMVVVLGIAAWARFGSATAFSVKTLTPTFELKSAMLWATLVFALGGCEAAAFLGGEIKDARRNLPRGLLIAGVTVAFCYIMGTFFVLLALPSHETSILDGVIQAIERSASRFGIPGVTSTAAILIAVSNVGAAAAFLAAAARLPFVAGMEGLLPKAFGRIHPKWKTPWVAVLSQGVFGIVFVITYMLPYLFVFASLIRVQTIPAEAGVQPVPGGKTVARFVAVIGFTTATLAIVLSLIPPESEAHPWLATAKIVGSSLLMVGVGLGLYWLGKRKALQTEKN